MPKTWVLFIAAALIVLIGVGVANASGDKEQPKGSKTVLGGGEWFVGYRGTGVFSPVGNYLLVPPQEGAAQRMPYAGVIRNLSMQLTAAPPAGATISMTVLVNDAATAVRCTVPSDGRSCVSSAATYVKSGDFVGMRFAKAGEWDTGMTWTAEYSTQ